MCRILISIAVLVASALTLACSDDGGSPDEPTVVDPEASPPTIPLVNAEAICASDSAPTSVTVGSPDIVEASGLAVSRTQEDVIWVHNDSGDTGRIFAINSIGETLAAYELAGFRHVDWEAMAVGPGPGEGEFLYVGDIGDNGAVRESITVYRMLEPIVDSTSSNLTIDGAVPIELRYEDGPHDAETLLIDPISGDLVIVTKELATGQSGVFRARASELAPGAPITLAKVGEIDFYALRTEKEIPPGSPALANVTHVPTGGDVSPDGSVVVLRTYATVWVWDRWPSAPLEEAFTSTGCEGPSEIEQQGESISFGRDGLSYFTVSEGANPPLHQFTFD